YRTYGNKRDPNPFRAPYNGQTRRQTESRMDPTFIPTAERRKQVKLRIRADLAITEQRYEGRLCHVVKDPVSLKYYRFNHQEYFVFQRLTGGNTLEEIRKEFEKR